MEVAKLSHSIARMATSLAARADYIRTFANNVSHEFKTPLTSLKGSVELLQDYGNTMDDQERQQFLGNMAEDINGLDRMVHRLLELARADVIRPGSATCTVKQVVEELGQRYQAGDGEVEITAEEGLPEVNMDLDVLVSIVANLIDNALQHGGANVRVRVSVRPSTGGVEWLVQDSGGGISKANAQKIFRPFFTTARHKGGTGLGLSIAQSLLAAHNNSSIELMASEQETTFRLLVASG